MKITLNIGLEINKQSSDTITRQIRETVRDCLELAHDSLLLTFATPLETFTGKGGEETLEVKIELLQGIPRFEQWLHALSVVTQQDCIAYQCDESEVGKLIGPKAEKWGAFNADFFGRP